MSHYNFDDNYNYKYSGVDNFICNLIKKKLIAQENLTKKQVVYVKKNIEPKYKNDCPICRLNVMLFLDVEESVAFAKQQPG